MPLSSSPLPALSPLDAYRAQLAADEQLGRDTLAEYTFEELAFQAERFRCAVWVLQLGRVRGAGAVGFADIEDARALFGSLAAAALGLG
jgi:hypothetical protein